MMLDADRDPVHRAAADWFVRLRSPDVFLEETMAWQSWIDADPRHAAAFARVEETFELLQKVPRPPRPQAGRFARHDYDASVALRDWRMPARNKKPYALAASIALVAAAIAWAATIHQPLSWSGPRLTLQTMVGENRTLKLTDGSSLTLGGDTLVEVTLTDKLRGIELKQGEAFFVVAKDPVRPFKVQAGDTTVVAVGTEFNVRRGSDRVVVAVVEGRVRVEPTERLLPVTFGARQTPVALDAGQQTTINRAVMTAPAPLPDAGSATAWKSGRLAFRLQPLKYVLEDVNRYAPKRIEAGEEAIGSLAVTGTVMADNVSGWVESLKNAFGIEAVEEKDRIVLRSR